MGLRRRRCGTNGEGRPLGVLGVLCCERSGRSRASVGRSDVVF